MNFLEKIFYFFIGFVSYIVLIDAFLISVIYRFAVYLQFCQNKYRGKYKLMDTGIATIMAGETKGAVNVMFVLKCKGTPNFDAIVKKLYRSVEYETKLVSGGETENSYRPFEKLGHVVVEKFGVFCWKLDHTFRAENHVVMDDVYRDLDKEIQERCEQLLDTFYGDHQPQWEMHVLFRKESKEYAIIWSVHHSYADATIFTQLVRYTLADNPFPIKIDPLEWNRKKQTFYLKIMDCIETLFICTFIWGIPAIFGQCLGQTTVKENTLKEKRGKNHCRAVTLDLTDFKAIQQKLGKDTPIRLVSVMYACLAPAINRAISTSKLKKPTTVLCSTVEANYPYASLELTVDITSLWFDLPLNITPLEQRLRVIDTRIRKVTGHIKMRLFKMGTTMIGTVISPLQRLLEKSGSLTQTTYISNIVGAQNSFTIFDGDLVTSMYIYSPISLEETVTTVGYTYDGKITFTVVAPDRVIRKLPALLDDIVVGIEDEMYKYLEFCKTK